MVKVNPKFIDFGFCPVGQYRTAHVQVENLVPYEVSCTYLILKLSVSSSSAFETPLSDLVLQPREKKNLQVKFRPEEEGIFSELLLVVSVGGEVIRVKLAGRGGSALKLYDTKLDFGPTDVHYEGVTKRLFLQNKFTDRILPVSFEPSTNEIVVNNGKPVILKPNEGRKIDVEFTSSITGSRFECITIRAPSSSVELVQVLAFSGPTISVPVFETSYLPLAMTSMPSSLYFPIANKSDLTIQLLITIPTKTPFALRGTDIELSSTKVMPGNIEMKLFESRDALGILVNLAGKMTATAEVLFMSAVPGNFRTTVTIQQMKPKKMIIGTMNLVGVALEGDQDRGIIIDEGRVSTIREFLAVATSITAGGVSSFVGQKASEKCNLFTTTSVVLDMEPKHCAVFGKLPFKASNCYEFIMLNNLSALPQPYNLLVSQPFILDTPLEGTIPPNTSLEIPIKLNTSYAETQKDLRSQTVYGTLTVFDGMNQRGFVSIPLYGIIGYAVDVDARDTAEHFKFQRCEINERVCRHLIVRNKLPVEIPLEMKTVTLSEKDGEAKVVISTSGSGSSSFSLSTTRMMLKPYEHYHLEITFQARAPGEFKARLFFEYTDNYAHRVNAELQKSKLKRILTHYTLSGVASVSNIELQDEFIAFGEVDLGSEIQKKITLSNISDLQALIFSTCAQPFAILSPIPFHVPKKASIDMDIQFKPLFAQNFHDFLTIDHSGGLLQLELVGAGGQSELTTDSVKLRTISDFETTEEPQPHPENIFDFGFVGLEHPKSKFITLINQGNFDIIITKIVSSDDQTLSWKFKDTKDDMINEESNHLIAENAAEMDLDVDETDHRQKDHLKIMAQEKRNTGNRIIRRGKLRQKSSQDEGTHDFPLRIPAHQKLCLVLSLSSSTRGAQMAVLKFHAQLSDGNRIMYQIWSKAIVAPPLRLYDRKIEFGTRAAHCSHVCYMI